MSHVVLHVVIKVVIHAHIVIHVRVAAVTQAEQQQNCLNEQDNGRWDSNAVENLFNRAERIPPFPHTVHLTFLSVPGSVPAKFRRTGGT